MSDSQKLTDFSFPTEEVRFDGGEGPARWEAAGIPKGRVPDQFVEKCKGGGINLHIYQMGWYPQCPPCPFINECQRNGAAHGESASL